METMKAIAMRRSVRAYTSEQVSEEALNAILAAGSASAMGMAAYDKLHLAVVQNRDLLCRMNGAIAKVMEKMMPNRVTADYTNGAPTVVVISAKDPDKTPMPGMHYINSGCVAENMMLAAVDNGLGSFVLGTAGVGLVADKDLQGDMGIPSDFTPLFAIALGYDAENKTIEKSMELKIPMHRI